MIFTLSFGKINDQQGESHAKDVDRRAYLCGDRWPGRSPTGGGGREAANRFFNRAASPAFASHRSRIDEHPFPHSNTRAAGERIDVQLPGADPSGGRLLGLTHWRSGEVGVARCVSYAASAWRGGQPTLGVV